MKKLLCILALCTFGCTDEESSAKALSNAGFTDIQFNGYSYFDCSEDDTYATKFTAKNPNGLIVEGTVCCGYFKKCTIRF